MFNIVKQDEEKQQILVFELLELLTSAERRDVQIYRYRKYDISLTIVTVVFDERSENCTIAFVFIKKY